ncbi:MAG: hypothetical protein QOE23_569 [Pseudonocardiales bacterium]|nr:hypothetical protein [Pseudonocardiales bacterium]
MPVDNATETSGLLGPLRRYRSARLLLGQLISRFGDAIYLVGVAAYAVQRHDGGLLAGALLGQSVGAVATLTISGAITDRVGARRMLILADLLRLAGLIGTVLFCQQGMAGYALFLGLGLLLGIGDGMFEPALTVALTEVLPAPMLLSANTLHSIFLRGGTMVGAAFAGVLLIFTNPLVTLIVDATTFGISLLLMVCTQWLARPSADQEEPLFRSALHGLRYVLARAWLTVSIATFALFVALAVSAPRVLLPLSLSEGGGNTASYGWVLAAQGFGAMATGLAAAWLPSSARPAATIFRCLVLVSVCCGLLGLAHQVTVAAVVAAIGGGALSLGTIYWATLVQRNVAPAFLARVSSSDWLVSSGLAPVSLAVMPWLLSLSSASHLLILFGLISGLVSVGGLCLPSIRHLRYADQGGSDGI